MLDAVVGDLVVVRFSPISVDKLRETAEDEYASRAAAGKEPWFGVSTRALRMESDVDSVVERICRDSGLRGRHVFVVTERHLVAAGFRTVRTEPPIHHYDVVLGRTLRQADLETLSALFVSGKRRHPLWSK